MMKTQQLYKITFLLLFFLPVSLRAQWNMVRFDKTHFFQQVLTVDADNAFVIGTEPVNQRHFLLKTTNGGDTWDSIAVSFGRDTLEFHKMFFLDKNTGFVGGYKSGYQFLMKTTNNGASWADVTPETVEFREIHAISFIDAQNGFVSNGEAFYSTTDGGANWTKFMPDFEIRDIHFIDKNTGFASGTKMDTMNSGVVMKTTDGGQSWQYLMALRDPNLFVSYFYKIDFIDKDTMITSMQNTNNYFRTTNGGQTWDTLTFDSAMYIVDYDFTTAKSGHMLTEKGQIFYTSDGGKTWNLQYSAQWGLYGPDVYFNSISVKNGTGYVSGSNGLIKKYKSGTVSIAEPTSALQLTVYPNPVSGNSILHIALPGNTGASTLQITNFYGQQITSGKLHANTAINLTELQMAPGIYYIMLINNNQRAVQKLVVTQ